jgi:hypothetical protein
VNYKWTIRGVLAATCVGTVGCGASVQGGGPGSIDISPGGPCDPPGDSAKHCKQSADGCGAAGGQSDSECYARYQQCLLSACAAVGPADAGGSTDGTVNGGVK